jgi:hypothetical protein
MQNKGSRRSMLWRPHPSLIVRPFLYFLNRFILFVDVKSRLNLITDSKLVSLSRRCSILLIFSALSKDLSVWCGEFHRSAGLIRSLIPTSFSIWHWIISASLCLHHTGLLLMGESWGRSRSTRSISRKYGETSILIHNSHLISPYSSHQQAHPLA